MGSPRSDFVAGATAAAPALVGVLPFGIIVGIAMVDAGIPAVHAVAMSVFVYAGASQLAAADLIGGGAPWAVVVLTALVVNLRFVMYSASIAPHFRRFSALWRAIVAYPLVDINYALSITEFMENDARDPRWYYLGTSVPLVVVWLAGVVAGVLVGARVPERWHLDFAVPLIFLTLVVSAVDDRTTGATAVSAGIVAVLAGDLPFDLGLIVGAVAGLVAGLAVERGRS